MIPARLALCLLCIAWLSGCSALFPRESPQKVVEHFFAMEQQGNFGGSWELFHPEMQKHWNKETYIQLRAEVMMAALGAHRFDAAIGTPNNVGKWTFPRTGAVFYNVQLFPTEITFQSVFGTVTLVQNFYMAEEANRWYILWDVPSGQNPVEPNPSPPHLPPPSPLP